MRRAAMMCAAAAAMMAGSTTAASAATTDPVTAQRLTSATLYLSSATVKMRTVTVATAATQLPGVTADVNSSLNALGSIDASSGLGLDPLLGLQGTLGSTLSLLGQLRLGALPVTSDVLGSVGAQLNDELNQLGSIDAASGLGLDSTLAAAGTLTSTTLSSTTALVRCLLCTRTT